MLGSTPSRQRRRLGRRAPAGDVVVTPSSLCWWNLWVKTLPLIGRAAAAARPSVVLFLKTLSMEVPFYAVRWMLHWLVWRRSATRSVDRVGARLQPWCPGACGGVGGYRV